MVFICSIALIFWLGNFFHLDIQAIQKSLAKIPLIYAGPVFIVLYVVVTFFIWFSNDLFKIASALLFGAYTSTLFIWIAEIINAFILFHFARSMGRGFMENSFGKKFKRWDERLERVNFFWLCMFRAVPLVPFRFLDLACGLTRISFRKYLAAVIIGSLPRIFWLQFILAGVGKSIYGDFGAVVDYLAANKPLLVFNLVYVVSIILVARKVRFD